MMENIKVSGVLYITDLLTKEGIIEKEEMASALERLLKSNNRLPNDSSRKELRHKENKNIQPRNDKKCVS